MKRFFWLAALLLIAFACNRELPVNEPIEVIEPDPVPAATVMPALKIRRPSPAFN